MKAVVCAIVLLVLLVAVYLLGRHTARDGVAPVPVNPPSPPVVERRTPPSAGKPGKPKKDVASTGNDMEKRRRPRSAPSGDAGDSDEDEDAGSPIDDETPGINVAEKKTLPGTDAQKIGALEALVQFRSSQAGTGATKIPSALEGYWGEEGEEEVADDDAPEEGQEDGVDPEDDGFRNTVNLLTLALEDASPSVRDAAFEAMFQLPDAERSVLSLQVLGGDDAVLKDQLLEMASPAANEFSVTLLMQALDDEDAKIKEKASGRLTALFSESFSSTEEALSWWEKNHESFVFVEKGMVPVPDNPADSAEENGADMVSDQ